MSVVNLETPFSWDHGALAGLTDDDHPQYLLLADRAGGQIIGPLVDTGIVIRDNAVPVGDVLRLEESGGDSFFDVDPTVMNFGDVNQRLFEATNVVAGYGGIEFYPDDFTRTTLADNAGANDMTLSGTTSADIKQYFNPGGWPVEVNNLGGAQATTFFDMFGFDQQCAPGTPPTVWRVSGAPDLAGAQAPAFPCGGPWEHITIGRQFTV